MRTKIAFVVLFTAWFSSQALAQWDWLSYPAPPPPPPPPPSLDQPDSLKSPPRQRRQSRPASRERLRSAAGGSTQSDARQGTVEEQKLRKEIQTKKRKSVAKQQRANKAAVTRSVTSSSSAGKSPTKPRSSISAEKKRPTRPSTRASAGTKVPVKAASPKRDLKETPQGTESPSIGSESAQHENDSSRISSDAAKNPAVVAFRNCIASYFARGSDRGIEGTWAYLLTRATEGECRPQFDDMAQILSKQFGKERVEQVMQQLIENSLLPAAKAAARGKLDTGVSAIPPQ
jgi:hypothetical protein